MQVGFDIRWRVGREGQPLDPRLFELLSAIAEAGSLQRGAALVRLSYRHAWGLLQRWEALLGQPLVKLERGRGARLTALGEKLLWADRRVAARLAPELESLASALRGELAQMLGSQQPPPLRICASHDLTLPPLRDLLHQQGAAHVDLQFRGSLDSLRLLAGGRCDLAGFHLAEGPLGRLLAPRYRPWLSRRQRFIHVAHRQQGLMIRHADAKGIRRVADLARPGVRFINRQSGSGTRVLLDTLLNACGLESARVDGYASEEFTHMAVAAMVASGAADAGFGIEAAAAQFDLHFIPVVRERYCLAVRRESLAGPAASALLLALLSPEFKRSVRHLRGYDPGEAGTLLGLRDVLPDL